MTTIPPERVEELIEWLTKDMRSVSVSVERFRLLVKTEEDATTLVRVDEEVRKYADLLAVLDDYLAIKKRFAEFSSGVQQLLHDMADKRRGT